jgi:hypothetical protein
MIKKSDLILILEIVRQNYTLPRWKQRKARFIAMHQTIPQPINVSYLPPYNDRGPGYYVFTVMLNQFEMMWYISDPDDLYLAYFQWQMIHCSLLGDDFMTRVYTYNNEIEY